MPSEQLDTAAKVLGVSPNTVRSWLREGHLASLAAADVDALRVKLDDAWERQGR